MQSDDECKGWLLTCDQNRQKQALKDAYNFLTEYIEQVYDDVVMQAIQKKLKQENKQISLETELKQSKKRQNKLLFNVQTNVKCVVYVKINHKFNHIDPVLIVDKIMQDVWVRNKQVTRYCHKILPVQKSFKAEHFKMLDVVDQLFHQKTQPNQVKSWSLNFKCRNNSKFNYKQVLRQCDKIAKKYGHFADIYYPQWTLSIQITNHLMCISLSEKYKQYSEYKLHKKVPKQQRPRRQQKQRQQVEQKQQGDKQQQQQQHGLRTQKQLRQLLNKKQKPIDIINANKQQVQQKIEQNDNEIKQKQKQKQNQQIQIKGSGTNIKLLKQVIKTNQQDDVDLF